MGTLKILKAFRRKRKLLSASAAPFVLILVLSASLIFNMYLSSRALDTHGQTLSSLALEAKGDGTFVYLMYFNSGYWELVHSWICNIILVDSRVLKRTLFVVGDAGASRLLLNLYPEAKIYSPTFLQYHEKAAYGSYEYFKMTLDRLTIQSSLLSAGISVFVVEADAVWFSPISEYILDLLEAYPIISADDGGNGLISAGFMYFDQRESAFFKRYTEKYRDTLENIRASGVLKVNTIDKGEQHMMTQLLQGTDLPVSWLDECHFARGTWYSDPHYRLRCPHPKVIQNNYVVGNENKIERAKEWGHWFVQEDGECQSKLPTINPLGNYNHRCEATFRSASLLAPYLHSASFPSSIMEIVNLADHVFVIGITCETCEKLTVNWVLRPKLTCVCADELNRCLVGHDTLSRTRMMSNSHGYVHLFAKRMEYKHIAVMEDGLMFKEPANLEMGLKNVKELLYSSSWTLVRFGARPHFLEGLVLDSCPSSCICESFNDDKPTLCIMGSGCDLRSAEFYISSERAFLIIAEHLNDDTRVPRQAKNDPESRSSRPPELGKDVFPHFPDQWLMLPVLSMKKQDYQLGDAFGRNLDEYHYIEHELELQNSFQRLCLVK